MIRPFEHLRALRRAVKPIRLGPVMYAPRSNPVSVDFDSLAWQRAIGSTPEVELIKLDDGDASDGIPLVQWTMSMRGLRDYRGDCVIECHADPQPWGTSGSVRVQVRRPNDPPFDDQWQTTARRLGYEYASAAPQPPTNTIQVDATKPAVAWAALLREAKILAIGGLLVALAACASAPSAPGADGGVADAAVDAPADAGLDAALDAPADAAPAGGLGLGDDCDPTQDQCAAGLTCRPTGKLRGHCLPVGPLPAGAPCQAESDCGYAMTWISDEGVDRCVVICHTAAPQPRCKPNQPCLSLVGHLGVCAP